MKKNIADIENIFRDASFSNPDHKDLLRTRLFEEKRELELGDLALVAGGVGIESPHDESEKTNEMMAWKLYKNNFGKPG